MIFIRTLMIKVLVSTSAIMMTMMATMMMARMKTTKTTMMFAMMMLKNVHIETGLVVFSNYAT